MNRRGFTVLEIVIALTVIGLLAGISAAGMTRYLERARVADAVMTMKNVNDELNSFVTDNGRLPDSLAELGIPVPIDPWGS